MQVGHETMKQVIKSNAGGKEHWTHHAGASSCGEVAACLVRVPTAVVTQNMQVGRYSTLTEAVTSTYRNGGLGGFYAGYGTTVAREIPFAFIQFPIYEAFKKAWSAFQGKETNPVQGAACGPSTRRRVLRPCSRASRRGLLGSPSADSSSSA